MEMDRVRAKGMQFWKRPAVVMITSLLAAAGLATAVTVGGVAFAQTQPLMTSVYLAAGLPVADPDAAEWGKASPVEVPLTPQAAVAPALLKASVETIRVQSLNDGKWIAFRLEWADTTKDDLVLSPDKFRDAAAIQLPVNQTVPGVCMGVRGQPVNLWHWKADWQRDIDDGFQDLMAAYPNFFKDYYPFAVGKPPFKVPEDFSGSEARRYLVGWSAGNPLSDPYRVTPVEELVAHGFGTATHLDEQGVLGRGVWKDGKWSVVFARPLATSSGTQAQLTAGGKGIMAVAAWNGANQEVGARKQISADFSFTIQAAPVTGGQPSVPVFTPGTVTTGQVQAQPSQGPSNWWIIIPVGLAVVFAAFGAGALGVYYMWYMSGKGARGGAA
jgi:hypothetical protein